MKHTPEPWDETISKNWPHGRPDLAQSSLNIHGGRPQDGHDGNIIAIISPVKYITEQDQANAERIVACVNACAGIEDPAEAIKAAQDALQELISVGCEFYDMDMGDNGALALQEARETLRKLGKEPE